LILQRESPSERAAGWRLNNPTACCGSLSPELALGFIPLIRHDIHVLQCLYSDRDSTSPDIRIPYLDFNERF